MKALSTFSLKIANINARPASELILCFAYFIQEIEGCSSFTASQIAQCFSALSIKPYSNIPSFLSGKTKGKSPIFLKNKDGYILSKQAREQLAKELSIPVDIPTSDALLDLSLVDVAPYYIQSIAKQMAQCYECCLFDATLVLMRKLIETLIIECFERYRIDGTIKGNNGDFQYLSDLIPNYLTSPKWNASRNFNKNIKEVKKYGDLSAHNRRFQAKKSDIDSVKYELRQTIQEIVLTIDYPSWNRNS
jgi:hypothetical protein